MKFISVLQAEDPSMQSVHLRDTQGDKPCTVTGPVPHGPGTHHNPTKASAWKHVALGVLSSLTPGCWSLAVGSRWAQGMLASRQLCLGRAGQPGMCSCSLSCLPLGESSSPINAAFLHLPRSTAATFLTLSGASRVNMSSSSHGSAV